MNQQEFVKQNVSIERFEAAARRTVNMRVLGVMFLAYGVCAPFWGSGMMPFWASVMIAGGVGGVFYIIGAGYVELQVGVWVDRMMVIHQKSKQDQPVIETPHIEESEVMDVAVIWRGTDQGWTVRVTPDQIRQLIDANMKDRELKRRHLSADVWPSLSRKWAEGEVQQIAKILGFIDYNNRFEVGWGSPVTRDAPEVGPPTDTPSGVGG